MEIIEVKRRLMSFIGGLAYPNTKLEDYEFNELIAERKKDMMSLEDRKAEYKGLKWASEHPNFDFRTCWHEKIPFTKKEVYNLLMKLKTFYEIEEYELLTDDRRTKEGWEL